MAAAPAGGAATGGFLTGAVVGGAAALATFFLMSFDGFVFFGRAAVGLVTGGASAQCRLAPDTFAVPFATHDRLAGFLLAGIGFFVLARRDVEVAINDRSAEPRGR